MTENQIEVLVEYSFDNLDTRFLRGEISQEDYDSACRRIHERAEARYEARKSN